MTTDFILKNATEEELADAVEENRNDMFRSMVRVLNGEIVETAKLGFQDTGRRISRYFWRAE